MTTSPGSVTPTKGHDMSRFWRLVSNENGGITGTWWVTRPNSRGDQHVRPVDAVMWDEDRRSGLTLHMDDFTVFINGGVVEPIRVRSRHAHVEAEAKDRLDEIAAVVLVVAAAVEWPADESDGGAA